MLQDKNVVVTGCLQGIGLATMRAVAREGGNVFACCQAPDQAFDDERVRLERQHGVQITPVFFDLLEEDAVKAGARQIQAARVPIHGLANVAGMTRDAMFPMVTREQMQSVFQVNFFSQVLLTQYVTRLMARTGGGSVVNVSSVTAFDGNPGQFVYSASKAAWIGASRTLAHELGPLGIRVNVVAPGIIRTAMTEDLLDGPLAARLSSTPLRRAGEPEEVANTIVFLLSDESAYVTGQVVRLDGGLG